MKKKFIVCGPLKKIPFSSSRNDRFVNFFFLLRFIPFRSIWCMYYSLGRRNKNKWYNKWSKYSAWRERTEWNFIFWLCVFFFGGVLLLYSFFWLIINQIFFLHVHGWCLKSTSCNNILSYLPVLHSPSIRINFNSSAVQYTDQKMMFTGINNLIYCIKFNFFIRDNFFFFVALSSVVCFRSPSRNNSLLLLFFFRMGVRWHVEEYDAKKFEAYFVELCRYLFFNIHESNQSTACLLMIS